MILRKKLLIFIILLLIISVSVQGIALEINKDLKIDDDILKRFEKAYVSRVIDGDTIVLENGKKLRFIGIDTPEIKDSSKLIRFYGREAYKFTKEYLEGEMIYLQYDIQNKDQYDRILTYIFLKDGTFFNAKLIHDGYAHLLTIPPNTQHVNLFKKLLKEARENGRGLWGIEIDNISDAISIPIISWQSADEYVGKEVVVEGKIIDTYDSGEAIFLNFDSEHWHTFTAAIFAGNKNNFIVDPEKHYLNKEVKIYGKIEEYKGAPEIIIDIPEQIKIVN
jgi:micrococcal nuclease